MRPTPYVRLGLKVRSDGRPEEGRIVRQLPPQARLTPLQVGKDGIVKAISGLFQPLGARDEIDLEATVPLDGPEVECWQALTGLPQRICGNAIRHELVTGFMLSGYDDWWVAVSG